MNRSSHGPNPDERGKVLSGLLPFIGLWTVFEALVFDLITARLVNDLLAGILLLAAGGYNCYQRVAETRVM